MAFFSSPESQKNSEDRWLRFTKIIYQGSTLDFSSYNDNINVSFSQVVEENKNRFSGAPKYGGWILDNCPVVKELWTVLVEKGITPDLVICLSNTENNGW